MKVSIYNALHLLTLCILLATSTQAQNSSLDISVDSITKLENIADDTYYSDTELSLKYYLQLIPIHESKKEWDKLVYDIWSVTGLYMYDARFDESIELCAGYLPILKKHSNKDNYLKVKSILASMYFYASDESKAMEAYTFVIQEADTTSNIQKEMLSKSLIQRSIIYANQTNYMQALNDLQKALTITDEAQIPSIVMIHCQIAYIYDVLLDEKLAEKELQKAIPLAKKFDDDLLTITVYQNTINHYLAFNKNDSALIDAKKGIQLALKNDEPYAQIKFYNSLARVYIYKNDTVELGKIITPYRNLAIELDLSLELAESNLITGRYYLLTSQYDSAKIYCKKAWEHYQNTTIFNAKSTNCKCLAESYKSLNNIDSAYKYLTLSNQYGDSLVNEKKIQETLSKKYHFDISKKETEFAIEKETTELKNKQNIQKKNILIIVSFIISLILILLVIFIIIASKRKKLAALSKQKEMDQAIFTQDLIKAQEDEKIRISREIHDSIGQDLILLKNQANQENQHELATQIGSTLNRMRAITQGLHPFVLEQFGLTAALQKLVEQIDEKSDIFITSEIDAIDNLLTKRQELGIYRIVQEAFNNIIKHSGAEAAKMIVTKSKDSINLTIQDFGKGIVANSEKEKSSLGMKTMQERAKILNAKLNIDSEVNKGTKLQLSIPIQND